MPIRPLIPAIVLLLSLAACNADQAPEAPAPTLTPAPVATSSATPAPSAADTGRAAAANASQNFQVIPATLPTCDPPTVVTLKWDLSASHPDIKQVQVWVGPDAKPVLFTAMGGKDEARTGPWATPGAIFRLRDPATGKELARVILGGPACPPAG